MGEGSADQQIEQVLTNLEAVLKDSGSGMDKLVRVNVYALSTAIVSSFREHLSKRLGPSVRPAITSVLTPLADRKALVAVDAVAAAGARRQPLKPDSALDGARQRRGVDSLPVGGRGRALRRCGDLAAGRRGVSLRPAG